MDMKNVKKAYLIGIKGVGMAAIAQILRAHGAEVSGSDVDEYFFTEDVLLREGIVYFTPFDALSVPADTDLVIYSTAYSESNNPEMRRAKEMGLWMMSYSEFLGSMTKQKFSIAVCGTHGKTTTSALLAHTLLKAQLDPSAVVGSRVINWGGGALSGTGKYFVFEADEYQNKFLHYSPWSLIFTSVDWDHPDFFLTHAEYKKAFFEFLKKIPVSGFAVVNGDDANVIALARESGVRMVTYGFHEDNIYSARITGYMSDGRQKIRVLKKGNTFGDFLVHLPGKHNAMNTCAVIAMCAELGVSADAMGVGIGEFLGTSRRFEVIGERNGVTYIDDYAHHPEEIKATLSAAQSKYPGRRVVAIFQPHTFTRTQALLEEFAQSFDGASCVYLLEIYGSAREQRGGVSSRNLAEHINRYNFGKAEFYESVFETVDVIRKRELPGDVVISIGAGNVWEITKKLYDSEEKE